MLKYVVEVPNKMFNGFREGVAFTNGRAEIESEVLKKVFEKYGYKVYSKRENKAEEQNEDDEQKKKSATKRKK